MKVIISENDAKLTKQVTLSSSSETPIGSCAFLAIFGRGPLEHWCLRAN